MKSNQLFRTAFDNVPFDDLALLAESIDGLT